MKKKFLLLLIVFVIPFSLFGQTLGDVNSDGAITIVDALLVSQYYVDLNPSNFNPSVADTNCNDSIDIIDALLIAQYYVGLIDSFSCDITPTPTPGSGSGYIPVSQEIKTYGSQYACAKPVMIGQNRYIVLCTGFGWGNPQGIIEVYEADANWNLGNRIGTSSSPVCDLYAKAFPDVLGNTRILIYGSVDSATISFVTLFDINSRTWNWAETADVFYITDIVYARQANLFYLVGHRWDSNAVNYLFTSSSNNLTNPGAWGRLNLPGQPKSAQEIRITYASDFNSLYISRCDKAYNTDLLRYNFSTQQFTTIGSWSYGGSEAYVIFGFVRYNEGKLGVTVPNNNPSRHFDVYYSTDGQNLIQLPNTNFPIYSHNSGHSEALAYCWPLENDTFLVHDSRDGVSSSFIGFYDMQGNQIIKFSGSVSHYSEASPLHDGPDIIIGGEIAPDVAGTDLKVITRIAN
ncbi:MAG: dockerin type I repeat-containing protein [Spirochaetales bacterium]|nr:dockerin type I repeat-containing protein [Spirochaetales bacterium]